MRGAIYRYPKRSVPSDMNADRADTNLGDKVQTISHATHHCSHDEPVPPIPFGDPSGLNG